MRLMFQDEAGFGRIHKPKYCWCKNNIRPSVPCHHIREYRYVYGAVEPLTGDNIQHPAAYPSNLCCRRAICSAYQNRPALPKSVFERGNAYDCLNADEEGKKQGKKEVP